jgi:hypothetical protein
VSFGKIDTLKKEYLVRVNYMTEKEKHESEVLYSAKDGGVISYKYIPHKRNRNAIFSWGPLQSHSSFKNSVEDVSSVTYYLVTSTNRNAQLDSVCAIRKRSDVFYV